MKTLITIAAFVLFVSAVACEGEPPAPVREGAREYRNPAAEYLLAEAAKREIKRLASRPAPLKEVPEDFPRAFVDLPGATLQGASGNRGLTAVTQRVPGGPDETWEFVERAAEESGWQLDVVTQDEGWYAASFLNGSQHVRLNIVGRDEGTNVTAIWSELDPEKLAPATE